MGPFSPEDIARAALSAALAGYQRDGEVEPKLLVLDELSSGVVATPAHGEPRETFPPLLLSLAPGIGLARFHYVVTCAEAWIKTYARDDLSRERIQHGDLQRMHEALDMAVKTAVVIWCYDVRRPGQSVMLSVVNEADDGPARWSEPFVQTGPGHGEIPDRTWAAIYVLTDVMGDEGLGFEMVGRIAGKIGVAREVIEITQMAGL